MFINGEPDYWGPGFWLSIHLICFWAKDKPLQERLQLAELLKYMLSSIPCARCREHALRFVRDNDPSSVARNHELGLFAWSFLFHNAVNSRLGKPQPEFEDVRQTFADSFPCDKC
ncbi:hypothetical protein Gasu2_33900 [Galdieria sulphuraria]|nr:hypothetical protein Gasu2_33900 [Galdieria sulphuraria]